MVATICQKLEEDFGGKFWIVFKEGDSGSKPDSVYDHKIEEVLQKMLPDAIHQPQKTIYFKPISVIDRHIGILVVELNSKNLHTSSLGKVLPILADQI